MATPPPLPARSGPPPPPPLPRGPPPIPSASSSSSAAVAPLNVDAAGAPVYVVSPKKTIEELMSADSSDAALAQYKARLLGGASSTTAKFPNDPRQIVFDHVDLIADGRKPIVLDIYDTTLKSRPFTLKEGSAFHLVLHFYVQHDLVSGLKFSTAIHKFGVTVDRSEEMVGSFAPSGEKVITFRLPEETAPSGFVMRGSYTAEGKLIDDDGRVHAQWDYAFEIKKQWE